MILLVLFFALLQSGLSVNVIGDVRNAEIEALKIFDSDALQLKIPNSPLEKLLRKPAKTKSVRLITKMFIENDNRFLITAENEFVQTHIKGVEPESFPSDKFFTVLDKVEFERPDDIDTWKKGESRMLYSKDPVNINLYKKEYPSADLKLKGMKKGSPTWKLVGSQKIWVEVKATRLTAITGDGIHKDAIFLENLVRNLGQELLMPGVKVDPEVLITTSPIKIDGQKVWLLRNVFLSNGESIYGTKEFIQNHVYGKSWSRDVLFKRVKLFPRYFVPGDYFIRVGQYQNQIYWFYGKSSLDGLGKEITYMGRANLKRAENNKKVLMRKHRIKYF